MCVREHVYTLCQMCYKQEEQFDLFQAGSRPQIGGVWAPCEASKGMTPQDLEEHYWELLLSTNPKRVKFDVIEGGPPHKPYGCLECIKVMESCRKRVEKVAKDMMPSPEHVCFLVTYKMTCHKCEFRIQVQGDPRYCKEHRGTESTMGEWTAQKCRADKLGEVGDNEIISNELPECYTCEWERTYMTARKPNRANWHRDTLLKSERARELDRQISVPLPRPKGTLLKSERAGELNRQINVPLPQPHSER